MEPITDIGSVEIQRSQQALWKSGTLAAEWARRFPELFDEDDRRLAETQGPLGYHFCEWLAAIVLHHATGYLSLVSKYEFAKHRRKQEIVEKLLPANLLPILRDRTGVWSRPASRPFDVRARLLGLVFLRGQGVRGSPATRAAGEVRGSGEAGRQAGPSPAAQMGACPLRLETSPRDWQGVVPARIRLVLTETDAAYFVRWPR